MDKHTPGPWGCAYTSNHAHDYRLTHPNGSVLPLNVEANDHSEQRANARLIAASPDMITALREAEAVLAEAHENCGGGEDTIFAEPLERVRAAIIKAEGRQ
jgi:hypothetical protein